MYEDEMPLGRAENLAGKKFGRLTALYRAKRKRDTYWKCSCECGGETIARATDLKKGHTQSCGCYQKDQTAKNIRGQKFGRLTALYPTEERKEGHIVWMCKCDCGNEYKAKAVDLIRLHTTSCGCLQPERAREANFKDLTNMRFGKITALRPTEKRAQSAVIWECICDCGTVLYEPSNTLLANRVSSCGCENSKGEFLIRQILLENNIPFETQKTFETCRLKSGYKAKFDFYVNGYCIEFDGKQHFQPVSLFGGEEQFKIQQERDAYKNQWCKENHIPLIRIPYTKLGTLCLNDLKLETTNFRIV